MNVIINVCRTYVRDKSEKRFSYQLFICHNYNLYNYIYKIIIFKWMLPEINFSVTMFNERFRIPSHQNML